MSFFRYLAPQTFFDSMQYTCKKMVMKYKQFFLYIQSLFYPIVMDLPLGLSHPY